MKWTLIFLLFSSVAWAEQTVKPVSLSYDNIIQCFPQLSDPGNSFKVDLNRLKELMDSKITTLNSSVRHRVAIFKDSNDQKKRLTYERQGTSKNYSLNLEKLDDKLGWIPDPTLPQAQRINPKPRDIGSLISTGTLVSDEYMYDDTKLNGLVMTYQRSFSNVHDLQLSDKLHKKVLSCENQKDLGIICTCSKK